MNVINLQLSIYVQPPELSFSASSCRRLKNVVYIRMQNEIETKVDD